MADTSSKQDPIYANRISDQLLSKLGSVITRWAFAEAVIEDMIAGFIGADVFDVYTLTANINISTRIEALRAISRLKLSKDDFERLSDIISTFKTMVPFRNKVVHGLWEQSTDPDTAVVYAIKSSGKLKIQNEYVNSYYLDYLDNQIATAAISLLSFGRDFNIIRTINSENTCANSSA